MDHGSRLFPIPGMYDGEEQRRSGNPSSSTACGSVVCGGRCLLGSSKLRLDPQTTYEHHPSSCGELGVAVRPSPVSGRILSRELTFQRCATVVIMRHGSCGSGQTTWVESIMKRLRNSAIPQFLPKLAGKGLR